MKEKRLEILVNGKVIGKITMESNSHTTIVDGGGIISTGPYLMSPKKIKDMIYKRMERNYPEGNIEIKTKYKI